MPVPAQLNNLLNKYMYQDKVTIYRQIDTLDEDGADDYKIVAIYTDIPCKLSQDNNSFLAQNTDRQVEISTELKLFLAPDYDIHANDILKIQHCNQEFLLNAVKNFKYKSHQELIAKRKDEAK